MGLGFMIMGLGFRVWGFDGSLSSLFEYRSSQPSSRALVEQDFTFLWRPGPNINEIRSFLIVFSTRTQVVPFFPCCFGVSLWKLNLRKKVASIVKGYPEPLEP